MEKYSIDPTLGPGRSILYAKGEFESGNAAAAGNDVCRSEDVSGPGLLPTPAASGEQMTVTSTHANDTAAGSGIQAVRIHYLNTSGVLMTEDVEMNGTGDVDTVYTDAIFVQDFYSIRNGSIGGVGAGNVTIIKKGGAIATDLYSLIAAGGNKSLIPHRMVPAGQTLYLQSWRVAQSTASKRAAFRIRSTDMYGELLSGVFLFKDTCYIGAAASPDMNLHSIPVPAFSIVKVTHWSDTVGTEGSCSWWGYLKNDGT